MALLYTTSSDQWVNYGSAANLDDLSARTVMVWVKLNGIAGGLTNFLVAKRRFGGLNDGYELAVNPSGFITFFAERSTTNLNVISSANALTTGVHYCIAGAINGAGAAGDQELYFGTQTAAMQEVSSYSTQTVGSGTYTDASYDLITGYADSLSAGDTFARLDGEISLVAIWSVKLSLAELIIQQNSTYAPVVQRANCVLFSHQGVWGSGGTGTQLDISGNGNHGTVSGPTKTPHAPIHIFRPIPTDVPTIYPYYLTAVQDGSDIDLAWVAT